MIPERPADQGVVAGGPGSPILTRPSVSSFLEHVIPVTLRVPDLLKAFYSFLVGHSLIVDRSIWLIVFVVEVRTPAQQQRGLAFPHLSPPERR
jgi:hypothetical protein